MVFDDCFDDVYYIGVVVESGEVLGFGCWYFFGVYCLIKMFYYIFKGVWLVFNVVVGVMGVVSDFWLQQVWVIVEQVIWLFVVVDLQLLGYFLISGQRIEVVVNFYCQMVFLFGVYLRDYKVVFVVIVKM